MKPELKISRRNGASAENRRTGSREMFHRLTLRPATGFSPREKYHLDFAQHSSRPKPATNWRRRR